MNRIGISFKSSQSSDDIRQLYIQPLRAAIEQSHVGIYANYLRQADADPDAPAEHLLVFHVHDFEQGLRLLRTALEKVGPPVGLTFHNLDPSQPMY